MPLANAEFRREFESWAASGTPPSTASLPLAAAALMSHAAFVEPVRQIAIFDAIASAWLDLTAELDRAALLERELRFPPATNSSGGWQTPRAVWDAFWAIVDQDPAAAAKQNDANALDFTGRVVAIGLHYDHELLTRCEHAVLLHSDVQALLAEPEVRMTTDDLRDFPPDSLGTDLLNLLTSKGYDLEVINADDVMLPPIFPAQNRTNRRILQLHDVWHLFAGYGFTAQGEVGISGFQLAQFGQNYSTRFLAVVTTATCLTKLVDVNQFISLIAEGWRHGRRAPPLMSVPWHKLLGKSIPQLRVEMGVAPFKSRSPEFLNFGA
jgi:ubiquinone biosynthesis protein Coq4